MKRLVNIICILFLLSSCVEEYRGQYPIDSIAPQTVTDPQVENLPGSVKITYKIPNETDVLYVKARYTNSHGVEEEIKSSIFKNELVIKGFGKSKKQTIELITVDRSKNESEPLSVEIEPLDSEIYSIYNSLKLQESWGGFLISWDNPAREQIIMDIFRKDDGKYIPLETFYSTEVEGEGSIRGQDSTAQNFYVTIHDVYNNQTDTLEKKLKPWYEIRLPGKSFQEMPLAPGYSKYHNGIKFTSLFDENTSSHYYMKNLKPHPYFTADLGKVYELSRIKTWISAGSGFKSHHAKVFEIWGTADPEAAADPANWEGWTLLLEGHSHKPSGDDIKEITGEDKEYLKKGEEFEVPRSAPPIRFFRYRAMENWNGSNAMYIGEVGLWGREYKK